jgi:3-hydroxybutyryl-CoA dehydrogenase
VETVGVLGTGTIGAGIVQVASQAGYRVVACDRSVEALEKAQRCVRDGLVRFALKGIVTEGDARNAYDRVRRTVNAQELGEAEAAIEAVVERVEAKKEAIGALDTLLRPGSLILTNTSSISVTELASATGRPDKVCGTHFFPPPPLREAVEAPRGLLMSDETVERVRDLLISFGKLPVVGPQRRPRFRD